jgi:hypothetical protein
VCSPALVRSVLPELVQHEYRSGVVFRRRLLVDTPSRSLTSRTRTRRFTILNTPRSGSPPFTIFYLPQASALPSVALPPSSVHHPSPPFPPPPLSQSGSHRLPSPLPHASAVFTPSYSSLPPVQLAPGKYLRGVEHCLGRARATHAHRGGGLIRTVR